MTNMTYEERMMKAQEVMEDIKASGSEDDIQLVMDMLEGECDILRYMSWMVQKINESLAKQDAMKALAQTYTNAAKAHENDAGRMRAMLSRVLEVIEQDKVQLPEATVYMRPSPPKVIIFDEKELPSRFLKTEVKVDKRGISDALKRGDSVPGASLNNNPPSLAIRTKGS